MCVVDVIKVKMFIILGSYLYGVFYKDKGK